MYKLYARVATFLLAAADRTVQAYILDIYVNTCVSIIHTVHFGYWHAIRTLRVSASKYVKSKMRTYVLREVFLKNI